MMHGQLCILGVHSTRLSDAEKTLFQRIQPGGFIIFGRNVESPAQLRALTDELRDISEIDPIIGIDQEGGRVSRTRGILPDPPSAQDLREKGDVNLMAVHGEITADILSQLGINMNFAPVLDISYDDEADNALRGRCWGGDSQEVITNAGNYNRFMRKRKMLSCGKHFPSCGLANIDPHHELPRVDKSLEEMLASDLLPYTTLAPELDAIMTCHAHFSKIDPEQPGLPGSLSRNLIYKILRLQLGYEGVIMTDDLDMGAMINTYGRGADVKLAIEAGNDMVLICHQTATAEQAYAALAELPVYMIDDALKRIHKLKKRIKFPPAFQQKQWDKLYKETTDFRVRVLGEERANAETIYPEGKRSPVEDY